MLKILHSLLLLWKSSYRQIKVDTNWTNVWWNNPHVTKFEEAGLSISGKHPERDLVETIELPEHPWFIGCQYHPELQSKPLKPHPLFSSFIEAAYVKRRARLRLQET